MSGPTNTCTYCECTCGAWFQVLNEQGSDWDEQATMSVAYLHYVTCEAALEQAPHLIVAMNETLIAKGFDVPTVASQTPTKASGKGGR